MNDEQMLQVINEMMDKMFDQLERDENQIQHLMQHTQPTQPEPRLPKKNLDFPNIDI